MITEQAALADGHASEFIPSAPFTTLLAGYDSPYTKFYPNRREDDFRYLRSLGHNVQMASYAIRALHDTGSHRSVIADFTKDRVDPHSGFRGVSLNFVKSNFNGGQRLDAVTVDDPGKVIELVRAASTPYDKESYRLAVHLIFRACEITTETLADINSRLGQRSTDQQPVLD